MDLAKSLEYFNPNCVKNRIYILGCGSVGGTIAECLARFGLTKMTIYDPDYVEAKNVVNQIYNAEDIGKMKVDAIRAKLKAINPEIEVDLKTIADYYTDQRLSGHVFLCIDNIDVCRKIVEENKDNPNIRSMWNCRTRLTDAQCYAADWTQRTQVTALINSMQFSHEEAVEATPQSACHVALCVRPTVSIISDYCVMNFIRFMRTGKLKKYIEINLDTFESWIYD